MPDTDPHQIPDYDPDRHGRPFGWRWVDSRLYRAAYRSNARLFATLSQQDLAKPHASLTRAAVVVISVALLLAIVAMFAGGIALIVVGFPSLWIIPGTVLVVVAIVLRPRFGRIDPLLEPLTRDQAPTLFRLIDRVADAIGAPGPHVVGVDRDLNAFATAVGLRRTRVLGIGLPLWVMLAPQQRVALLAHELGHFANGDIRRGPLTQLAFTTIGTAAILTHPDPDDLRRSVGLWYFAALCSHVILWIVSGIFSLIHIGLLALALRDSQRGEYLADRWAVTVAGSAGARGLTDTLVTSTRMAPMVARAAMRTADVAQWRQAAAESRERLAADLPSRRERSISDEATLFAGHPPAGLRHRMVEARPWQDPTVVLTEAESAQIDAELATPLARARRDIGAMVAI